MRRTIVVFLCLVLAGPGLPLLAQEDTDAIARELAAIRILLERMLEYRDVDVVLERIALEERRLQPIERKVLSAEQRIQRLEEELRSLEELEVQTEERMEEQSLRGADNTRQRRRMQDVARTRRLTEERLETARYRLTQVEAELAEGQKAIEDLDDLLASLLED